MPYFPVAEINFISFHTDDICECKVTAYSIHMNGVNLYNQGTFYNSGPGLFGFSTNLA